MYLNAESVIRKIGFGENPEKYSDTQKSTCVRGLPGIYASIMHSCFCKG
jgi:hypothetical protein